MCQDMVAKKTAEVSRLRGFDSITSQCGRFEFNVLVNRRMAE